MTEIKPLWQNHPLYTQGKIELVPTEWVWKYRGPDVAPVADLKDGRLVDLETLWQNICEEGLHDPLIMRVGIRNQKFRLESGNHRIQVFHQHSVSMVPVTVQVTEECGPHVKEVMTTGSHNFDTNDELLISEITEEYMKPSKVFKSLKK